jgi:hypothetical protein
MSVKACNVFQSASNFHFPLNYLQLHVDIKKQYSHRSLQNGYLNLVQAANAVTSDLTNMTLDNYIADQLESFGFLEKMTATNRQYCAMKSLTPGKCS